MVVDPLGNVISQAGSEVALIICDINLEKVYNIRDSFKLKG